MMYYGNGMGGWGMVLMTVSSLLFWGLVIAGIVALVRSPAAARGSVFRPRMALRRSKPSLTGSPAATSTRTSTRSACTSSARPCRPAAPAVDMHPGVADGLWPPVVVNTVLFAVFAAVSSTHTPAGTGR